MNSSVTAVPPAPSALAREHFAAEFTFETDCWDVHDALENPYGFKPVKGATFPREQIIFTPDPFSGGVVK